MKYSVLGFNQEAVCSISKSITDKNGNYKILTLDVVDLLIIQEIADFMNRKRIIKYTIEDKIYFSIKYDAIVDDLPILGIKKQALRDRIDKMCELGVIEKQIIKDETGSWVAFRLGDVYEELKYKPTWGVCSPLHTGVYSTTHGCVADYTPNNYNTITNNTITNNKKIEDKSSKKEAKIESDEDEFVEKIYSLYPAKCPKRNISLGKTYKDKDRIRKLLRTYSREDIERVVKQEVNEKYGKCYMSNFSTFLNNFPDPNSLFGKEQENTSNTGGEEDMMQKFLALTESEQAKILQLDAYQYHMLPASAKEGWMNNRKQFILQWFTENG